MRPRFLDRMQGGGVLSLVVGIQQDLLVEGTKIDRSLTVLAIFNRFPVNIRLICAFLRDIPIIERLFILLHRLLS